MRLTQTILTLCCLLAFAACRVSAQAPAGVATVTLRRSRVTEAERIEQRELTDGKLSLKVREAEIFLIIF